jgi:hypothetical protein
MLGVDTLALDLAAEHLAAAQITLSSCRGCSIRRSNSALAVVSLAL